MIGDGLGEHINIRSSPAADRRMFLVGLRAPEVKPEAPYRIIVGMDKIRERFNRDFSNWDIYLPRDAITRRDRGKIVKGGWVIWYCFGKDSQGEYLDYYSSHRMTDDRHTRVYEDGHIEDLPTIISMYRVTQDPEESARIKADFYARNQEVTAMLAEKGFGLSANDPGGVQINRYLHVWPTRGGSQDRNEDQRNAPGVDLGPNAYVSEFQAEFLKNQVHYLTLQASLSTKNPRYPIYARDVSDKERLQFRTRLVKDLETLAINFGVGSLSHEEHTRNIGNLARSNTRRFSRLLHNGTFRIGVAQKALNLFLKFLWCLGEIHEPPHCPFDSIVIGRLKDCEGIKWTEFNDIETYEHLVRQARAEAKGLSLAEWELRLYNQQ